MSSYEKSDMEIIYEEYLKDKNRLFIFQNILLYKIIHKSRLSLRDGTILITIPWEVLSIGTGPFFDENGNRFILGSPAHMSFRGNAGIPEWYMKTATVTVEGIHDISEIGSYIGQINKSNSWLADSEITHIFECRKKWSDNGDDMDTNQMYQLLFDEGFAVMNPNIKYLDLLDENKRKRNKILKAVNVMGNKLFNEPFLSCPICGHDFVAHNIYDFNYPYVDTQMLKEYVQPLTFADKCSEYKYYCLTCGSEFEIQDIPKKVFHFERGAYFAGTLEYTVWEMHDHMLFESQSSNDFCHMRDYRFSFPKEDMNLFNPLLKPILKWKTTYENKDEIYDGYGWSIEYSYEGFSIKTGGYEAWPIDYKFRIRKLQQLLEKLCKKYAIDYSIEESKERLLL